MTSNTQSKQVIALDVGGASVKSASVTSAGHIPDPPIVTPIDSSSSADTILATLTGIIQHHLKRGSLEDFGGVAVGMPGPFDYEVGVSYIKGVAKFEALYGLNIKEALRDRLGLAQPIVFRNDAEAAIVGEARYGAGRPYRRLIGVTLGTGCGSAFLIDSTPQISGPGVPANGWLYPINFRGRQADDVFSTRGLQERFQAKEVGVDDVETAAAAAQAGSDPALEAFRQFGQDLADFLHPFATDFQADAVLVLGGIANAYKFFGLSLRRGLSTPVVAGRLGPDSALLGAAELLFKPRATPR